MVQLGRRTTLLAGVGIGAAPALAVSRLGREAPAQARDRIDLPTGARSGEVTTDSAVVWARAGDEGRLTVRLRSNARTLRSLRGPWTDARTDHTARLHLTGLAPGREYDADVWFAGPDGSRGRTERITFRTAPIHPAATSFVWSGDTCGQGWGINPDLGGLTAYSAMLATRPDFFLHSGDTIYGDEPMEETTVEDDGQVWRNRMSDAVAHVSETLEDFRGRHRYPLTDDHVRALYAEVPTIAQWDDHETLNNWYPGELHDDDRYTERRCDVLARRGRRAWQEYQPVPVRRLVDAGGDGFATTRIYRRVPRGPHLDLICLDMRSYRGPNDTAGEPGGQGILGPEQERWLIEEVTRSTATWKVISADLPLSLRSNHADDLDSVGNGEPGAPAGREEEIARVLAAFQAAGVRNVVWLTADVHYTAAHHYSPERATDVTDFDPFWEFVSGPIASETFATKVPDATFGAEVVYAKGNDSGQRQSPRAGNQFFGHVAIDREGLLTVTLHDGSGTALWSTDLEPDYPSERPIVPSSRT